MSQFRIAAKKLFLTYSQVNPEITAQEILYQLQNNPSLHEFRYVIAKELHQDGGVHFHVVLIQHEKVDIRNPKALDIQYQERNFHGNYAPIKNLRHAITYVCKHQDYITNLDNLRDGQLLSAKQFIISQVKEKGIEQALLEHYERDPEKAIAGISISALKKQFYAIHQTLSQPRFARRMLIVQPEQPFMVNVNMNIVNNVHIQNHNYNQDFTKHQEQEQLHIEETQRLIKQIINQ